MREAGVRHRLMAILAADAAGYSRLMAEDDRATLAALDAARTVFHARALAHGGRVVDTAGDSVLAVFEAASEAVAAALEIQQHLCAQSQQAARLQFRIGVHLGDVLEKPDGTVYGDGVNIAARLQALSEAGGTTVSLAVQQAVAKRVRAGFEDIGEHAVKNIAEPVRAYRLRVFAPDDGRPLRFDRCEVRPQERRLLIDGHDAGLGGRALDLLLVLIQRRDRVVTKGELFDRVWPGLVVEDNNLSVQVSALRKVLGPRVIATVPGRGYRFAATLADELPASAERVPAAASTTPAAAADTAVVAAMRAEPYAPPALATPVLGRDDDLAALDALLAKHRLITVLGAGGIGKTTLAVAAAHARRTAQIDGAAFVDLAPVTQPAMVPVAVAQALHLPVGRGDDLLPALIHALKALQVLLVIDNAEHLVEAVARLADAVASDAPTVHLLVTSQAPLKCNGERVFRLGALAVPEAGTPPAEALQFGAVALFVDQAQAVERRFELNVENVADVIDLCRRLDGLALALKLAAARLPLLGLHGLQARLGERLNLLSAGGSSAPTRQQTLRAALDWGHGLLGAHEQIVFRRLGVFVGGFTLELAAAVASDDGLDEWSVIDHLATLVERSLVVADAADPPRYRLLESAREYALLRLQESGELDALRGRHVRAMLECFDKLDAVGWELRDDAILAASAPEVDNVRAALDWSSEHEPHLAVELVGAIGQAWTVLGLTFELRSRLAALEPALATHSRIGGVARYWVWRARSSLHSIRGRRDHGERAATLYRSIGDTKGLYHALCMVAVSAWIGVDAPAVALAEAASIEQADWPARLRALRHYGQAALHLARREFELGLAAIEAALTLARAAGDWWLTVSGVDPHSVALWGLGRFDDMLAVSNAMIAEQSHRRGGRPGFAWGRLGQNLVIVGRHEEGRDALARYVDHARSSGWEGFWGFGLAFVRLPLVERRFAVAARLFGCWAANHGARGQNVPGFDAVYCRYLEELKRDLDVATIERLMAEGAQLDEEAMCALALDPPPSTTDSSSPAR